MRGQPWYQDGSFAFLSDGKVNAEAFSRFLGGARWSRQAVKTRQLVSLYYGKAPKFSYYGRPFPGRPAGLQDCSGLSRTLRRLHDRRGRALSIPMFGTTALYAQIVMKTDLGYTAAKQAGSCGVSLRRWLLPTSLPLPLATKRGLGFLLDPFQCDYESRARCRWRCAPAWPATA